MMAGRSQQNLRSMLLVMAVVAFIGSALAPAQDSGADTVQPVSSSASSSIATGAQSSSRASTDTTAANPQGAPQPTPSASPNPNATLEDTIEAGESDDEPPTRKLVKWNEYEGPYITMRVGAGLLFDFAGYAQDTDSKEQVKLTPDYKLRDARFLLRGKFPKFKRSVTWSTGIMYDGPTHSFLARETGIMIAIPELWGNLFIGRTKEGFSLNKVMVGYAGWTMERSTMSDATIPILADGIKWLGYSPKHGFLWNAGLYNDFLSAGQSFSTYQSQAVGRFAWLPIHTEEKGTLTKGTLLHLGVNLRHGKPKDGQLQLKSRPESFGAPFFVDTGKFKANTSHMAGYEAYYRRGPWLVGSEYWWMFITSPSTGNPTVHGGDFVTTWLVTGETRAYNTVGGFFREVSPKKTVFQGGPGAWELVARYSSIDLDSEGIHGGKFKRFTPGVSWYLSREVRLEMFYGYGRLDRFDLKGNTQFFQSRIQFWL